MPDTAGVHDGAAKARPGGPTPALLLAVGGLYFIVALGSLGFVVKPENIAAVWPPSGISLAVLLLRPRRSWPAILAAIALATLVANLLSGNSVSVSLGFMLANSAEPALAASVMLAVLAPPVTMDRLSAVAALIGLAAIACNSVTALLGAAVAALGLGAPFWSVWRIWLVADGLGILMVCPVILTAARGWPRFLSGRPLRRGLADLAVLAALITLALHIFGASEEVDGFSLVLPYLTFPLLLWLAVRRGPSGAALSSLTLSGIGVWQTVRGHGPFTIAGSTTTEHILAVQLFLCVTVLSALVVAAVMSERVTLEGALEQSEQRFRAIFDSQFELISLMLPEGTLLEVNQTALDFGGLRAEEVRGKPFWSTRWWSRDPATQQGLSEAIRAAAGGAFVRYDVEVRGAGDRIAIVDFSIKPVRDEDGRVSLLLAEGREITEVKRAVQSLVEQEATLRSFFDSAGLMMGIVDIDAPDDIRHIRDNAISRAFLCLSPDVQYPFSARAQGIPGEVIAMWLERYHESAARGAPVQFEYEHPAPGGSRWLSATVCPIATIGATPRFAYVVQDITALKQQAARLSASLAEKEVLLREIHHRVKNNLQVISSMLHLQFMQASEPSARAQLFESERRVRAMALVHEQLYMATDLAGIEFSSYVNRLVTTLMRAYGSSQRRVTSRLCVAPLLLDIDTAMPCGLLVNELVSNSMKHAFPGDMQGEVWVSFARAGADHLVLSVRDTGIGLPPEIDIETARSMGLQLIRAFTAQLGGTIRCERRDGAEISVLFPCPAALREVPSLAG